MSLIGSLNSGVSALNSFAKGMEVIGDNISNVNTTGFKGSRISYGDNFGDLLQGSSSSSNGGAGSDVNTMQIGEGVNVQSVRADFGQGSLNTTGVPTDLGVSGNGFFRVRDPRNSDAFATRAGNFRVDDQGFLTTPAGLRVQGLNDGSATFTASVVDGKLTYAMGTPTVPATVGDLKVAVDSTIAGGGVVNGTGGAFTDAEVEASAPQITSFGVDKAGNITLQLSNGDSFVRGQVLLQNYQDPNSLIREPGNLFSGLTTASPVGGLALSAANNAPGQGGTGTVEQGSLELSNVDLTSQFADLITTQRSFQAGSRVITTSDTILEEIVNLKH